MQDEKMQNKTEYFYNLVKNAKTKEERDRIQSLTQKDLEENHSTIFNLCMGENNLYPRDVIKETHGFLSDSVVYHYMDGSRRPDRDRALFLALAAHFNLDQTERYLKALGYNILRPKYTRECFIMNSIIDGKTPEEVNSALFEMGLTELVPLEGKK